MTSEIKPLKDKVALVTGGSRGIGAAVVMRLVRDGAAVAFTYASAEQKALEVVAAVEAEGGRALAIQADSADAAALERAVKQTVETLGGLNILVSNAGILQRGDVREFSLEVFDQMFAVNVRAAFAAAQYAAREMGEGDRIILMGSVVAERSAFPGASVYSMTKSALVGLGRGIALDLAPQGITVNVVQPGPTATDMNPADGPHHEAVKSLVPLKRMGTGEEIAGMVAYLAGPESSFVTGTCLTVDGGYLA
ncbi:3-oxoacyl-ACP reductase FabG [Pseudomonas gingeri]|uniref:3-oxoacyl-ACP reductase family protein n=1 Tax=Pseudomonas gingeri TaxID=117681 RepID=UPI0015A3ADBF|nr:3-oxoacyl-ACP reductase family protein [Pseudomonas gingeri]NWD68847.1 3-oxoacyl-ACP reductase FabG [Pseudomonas gingeri]